MAVKLRSVATATNVDGTSGTSVTVTKPSQTADGDVMIAITHGYIADDGVVAPTDWELLDIADDSTGGLRSRAYRKIASSEGASYVFGFGGAGGAIGVSIASFMGGHDVHSYQWVITGTEDPADGTGLDASRDSVGYQVYCWRNDTANTTVTWSFGTEEFDVTAKATTAIRSGQSGMYYGPPDLSDIVNAGDEFPSATANPVQAPLAGIFWNFLVGDKAPDGEDWTSTNGQSSVEIKMDRVELDAAGGIATPLTRDVSVQVSAFSASAETEAASNAADGLLTTAWLDDVTSPPQLLTYDFATALTAKRYRITSAHETATYGQSLDPMNWTVEGSNNGSSWTVIDTRSNESFGNRSETREFRIADPGSYRYYKLNISANKNSDLSTTGSQLAEWRLSTVDVWEDVTSYVNYEDKIRITRGLQGSSGRSDYSRAYLTFDNTDGRFSLRNPNGAYHGAIQRNSETRISKAYGTKSLQLQGVVRVEGTDMIGDCLRCVSTAENSPTSDLDLRMDIEPEAWRDTQMLAGVSNPAGLHSWDLYLDGDAKLNFRWTPFGGGAMVSATSTEGVRLGGRRSIKVFFDANDGSGNSVVTFYTASAFNGTWEQLGVPVSTVGSNSIKYTGGALCIGHVASQPLRGLHGRVYNFELRDGTTLVSDIDFTAQTNGAHTLTETGNPWITVNNAVISNRRYRFHGETASWPVAWDPTGNWVYVSATSAGIQKRLERGPAAGSAMYRHHTRGVVADPGFDFQRGTAVAYWPMEDGKDSFQCASGLPGRPHLEIYGTPNFGEFSGYQESDPLPDLNGAKFGGRVVGADSSYVEARFLLAVPETAPVVGSNFITLWGTGTQAKFRLYYSAANEWTYSFSAEANLESGVPSYTSAPFTVTTVGELMHVRVILAQDGNDITITIDARNTIGEDLGGSTTAISSETFGRIYRAQVNDSDTASNAEIFMGHLALYGADAPDWESPINAWHYETAAERIDRICDEEDIEFRLVGDSAGSTFLGYQSSDSPQGIMSSAAVSDFGYLTDPLDAFGIEYRTNRSILSQEARLTVSYTGNELSGELLPVDDDSYLVNDATARRGDAGSARYVLEAGALSVNQPPHGVGTYAQEQSYSLAHEGQCVDIASWTVHQGTLDEERYPRIQLALENLRIAGDPVLIEAILNLDVGHRVDITDTPDFLPAQDIRQIVIGYEEWFDQFQHDFSLNTIPERTFEVAQYSSGFRFDTGGSELYQDIAAAETEILVSTTSGQVWTTDPAAIPIDWTVDGEQMRVTAVGRLISSNPFFDTDLTGWTAEGSAVIARSTDYVHYYEQAVASMKLTPDGVAATAAAVNTQSAVDTVVPLEMYEVSLWAYFPNGWSDVRSSVVFRTAAGASVSTMSSAAVVVPAGVWTHISTDLQAPLTASRAQARVRVGGTPAATDVGYFYSVRVVEKSEDPAFKFDSFNRANSTTNLGSTDDGVIAAWTQDSGTWGINSNAAYVSVSADSIATQAGTADFETLEVNVSTWASNQAWLNFRFTDTSNRIRFGGTVGAAAQLNVITAGVTVRTETSSVTLAAGDQLRVRCNGSVIECFVNGVLVLCITETAHSTATRVGMQTDNTAPRFNDFEFNPGTFAQTATVVRGVNGVTAPHPSGTEVTLYRPPYRGL